MKLLLGVLLVIGLIAFPGYASTPEASSKSSEPGVTPKDRAVPNAGAAESKPKAVEPLKWDQLDPRAIEQSTKQAQRKSPFTTVPAER